MVRGAKPVVGAYAGWAMVPDRSGCIAGGTQGGNFSRQLPGFGNLAQGKRTPGGGPPREQFSVHGLQRQQLLQRLAAPDQSRLAAIDQHLGGQRPAVVVR